MSFKDLNLKLSYTVPRDNVINDFYIPALSQSKMYKRATAYFTSASLLEILPGIKKLIENHGKIWMIVSPNLSDEDIAAIQKGYSTRKAKEDIVNRYMVSHFAVPENYEEKESYNILSHLIEDGIMDIKVAILKKNSKGLFHDKIGIMEDRDGNRIAFSGSMNETENAFVHNHEVIDVYSDYGSDSLRTEVKVKDFNRMWRDEDSQVDVFPFPPDLKAKIKEYQKPDIDFSVTEPKKRIDKDQPHIPEEIDIRDYQQKAIDAWVASGYRGIYDMATGTGKTITAIASIVRLLEDKKEKNAIIIVVPYQHLVEQWVKDLKRFNLNVIAGYSSKETRRWRRDFRNQIDLLKLGICKTICLVTTNASFSRENTQEMISSIPTKKLLVVDEAHNFGAPSLLKTLDERFNYRLALSATLDRHYDEFGTDALKTYFSPICIFYPLNEAINNSTLCSYKYYPIPVYLTEGELESYNQLSVKIAQLIVRDRYGNPVKLPGGGIKFKPEAQMLLIKRARIVAGAVNKIEALAHTIREHHYETSNHILIYCGATTINEKQDDFVGADESEIKQITAVTRLLRNEFDMVTAKYTSEETIEERHELIREFEDSEIQALIAIRCLDEGVDIPSVDKAFLLASTTNPKEYIQRRGRVLRQSPATGKKISWIYDFITLPRDLYEDSESGPFDLGLVLRELRRIEDFKKDALNKVESSIVIDEIKKRYDLDRYDQKEAIEYDI